MFARCRLLSRISSGTIFSSTSFIFATCEDDRLERQGFDRKNFDIYLDNATKKDLKFLLEQFENGLETWPWIWTWRNNNGPHYVFIGTDKSSDEKIQQLANENVRNNILVVTDNKSRLLHSDREFYYKNRCGLIEDVTVSEMDVEEKIIMLSDERVIVFDELHIV